MPNPKPKAESEVDPFYLDVVFPDPKNILRNIPLAVEDIAQDCLFVFDANALLTPFRVGKDSINDIQRVLQVLSNAKRLLVPAQALREYAKNRTARILDAYEHVQRFMTQIQQSPT